MFRWHDLLHPLHSYQSHICIFLWTLPWNVTNLSQLLTVLLHRTLTSYPCTHTSTHTCDPMWSVLTFFVIDCCSPFNSFVACLSHWAQLFLLFSITSAHEHFQSKNLIIYKFADVITFFVCFCCSSLNWSIWMRCNALKHSISARVAVGGVEAEKVIANYWFILCWWFRWLIRRGTISIMQLHLQL